MVKSFNYTVKTVSNGIPSVTSREEDSGVGTVSPPPNECEKEAGNHHRSRTGKKNGPEGTELTATVYPCSFFQFLRLVTEVLTHHVNVKTALISRATRTNCDVCPKRSEKVYSLAVVHEDRKSVV